MYIKFVKFILYAIIPLSGKTNSSQFPEHVHIRMEMIST